MPDDPTPKKPDGLTKTVVVFTPLKDVYLDFDFNARSRANVEGQPDTLEGGGPEELGLSLQTKGQDFPVTLRPNTHEKGRIRVKGQDGHMVWWFPPYELVDGFRRFFAIATLNADEKLQEHSQETGLPIIPNVPNGHIAAEVRPLDDVQATLLNGRAGIARNNLEPPDLMAHIVKLTRPPFGMTVQQISEDQGLGLTTTHRYATAGNVLLPAILNHWRFGGSFDGVAAARRLSFSEMESVSRVKKEYQVQAYKDALIGKDKKLKTKDWLHQAEQSAVRMGTLLARLEREGVVRRTSKPWEECVDTLVKLPARTQRFVAVKERISRAIEDAYDTEKKRDITKRGEKEGKR
jgi:hypothetical protein